MKRIKKTVRMMLCVILMLLFGVPVFAEAHEHKYTSSTVYASCTEQGYTVFVCSCGDSYKDLYVQPLGHHYNGWDAVQQATCTSEGIMERTCIRCGAKQTETVPLLDHRDSNADGRCDTCGLEMEQENVFSPFDWLVALFRTIFERIASFFSSFVK